MQVNNTLDFDKIEQTIQRLKYRINDRFPNSSLGKTCADFYDFTIRSKSIIAWIDKPNYFIRATVYSTIFIVLSLILYSFTLINFKLKNTIAEIATVLEASLNNVILLSVGIFFLYTLEKRWKRIRALKFLSEIRGFAHVVDMHQLTKDPQIIIDELQKTENSPERELTPFELQRYLDYCAEFLSLIGKVAALYSQSIPDEVVVQSSSEIEGLCSTMSNKIWQKLNILANTKVTENPS